MYQTQINRNNRFTFTLTGQPKVTQLDRERTREKEHVLNGQ